MRVKITISFLIFFSSFVNYNMRLLTLKRKKHLNLTNLKTINPKIYNMLLEDLAKLFKKFLHKYFSINITEFRVTILYFWT
jgi:hypothetical protein